MDSRLEMVEKPQAGIFALFTPQKNIHLQDYMLSNKQQKDKMNAEQHPTGTYRKEDRNGSWKSCVFKAAHAKPGTVGWLCRAARGKHCRYHGALLRHESQNQADERLSGDHGGSGADGKSQSGRQPVSPIRRWTWLSRATSLWLTPTALL